MSEERKTTSKALAHEARSHLTVIYGYLQLLRTSVQNPNLNIDNIMKLIEKTLGSCQNLRELIEKLDDTDKS